MRALLAAACLLVAGCDLRLRSEETVGLRIDAGSLSPLCPSSTLQLVGSPANSPAIMLSPTSHDFGHHPVGQWPLPQFTFHLRNVSGCTAGTPLVRVRGEFAVPGGTCFRSLGAGQSCDITVAFDPASPGAKSGVLEVVLTPGGAVMAALSGSGDAPPDAAAPPDATSDAGDDALGDGPVAD